MATSKRKAIDAAMQKYANNRGKRGLPSEMSFNVDPCVGRQVSLGTRTVAAPSRGALVGESPGGNAKSDFSSATTPTARYG